MASTKLWKTLTNLIVEKTLTIGQGGRLVQKNSDGTSVTFNPGSEILTATRTLRPEESGETFFLSSTAEFVTTLPLPALGLKYTFVVRAAPSGASYTIVTAGSANTIRGLQNSVFGDAGDFGATDDTISFVDGQSQIGDKVELYCDGTNWFAYAISRVAAGVTFTTAT